VTIGPAFGPSSKGAAVQQFGATIEPKKGSSSLQGARALVLRCGKVTIPARPYLPTRAGRASGRLAGTIVRETGLYLMGNA
jgi:phage gpG-like protein